MHVTIYCSVCILILPLLFSVTDANLLYGCIYKLNICDSREQCIDDGLFGQCRASAAEIPSYDIRSMMGDGDWELITMELQNLAKSGYKWEDARTQCLVAYFMFTIRYDLAYDTTFCVDAVHPENLWAMLESVQHRDELVPQAAELDATVIMSENELINGEHDLMNNHVRQMLGMPDSGPEVVVVPDANPHDRLLGQLVAKKSSGTGCTDSDLSPQETLMLNDMMARVLDNIEPDFSDMSDCQIDKFIARLNTMKNINHNITIDGLINEANKIPNKRDREYQYEEYGPVYMVDPELNKKDPEHFDYSDMGLDNVEHKIVKGNYGGPIRIIPRLHQIDGERVYVKLANRPGDIIDERMLIDYLQKTIGDPNNVTFADFRVDGSTISFQAAHVSRDVLALPPAWQYIAIEEQQLADSGKHFEESKSIADEIFKRERDIASVSGARVTETGVGDSENHVPVRPWRDDLTTPAIAVVGVLLGLLAAVGGTFVYRHRAEARQAVKRLAADIESRPAKTYEELCRQRMAKSSGDRASTSSYEARVSSPRSKQARTQSSGSWSDEPITSTAMDITTGHMILAYMEEHLQNKDKLSEDWAAMVAYLPDRVGSQVARAAENVDKNRDMNVVPYDHNRVQLKAVYEDSTTDYINASPLADAQMTDYVVSQAPLTGTQSEHWQMVWERNIVVMVNLTKSSENVERYWPDSGNARYGIFEVHLVSEHIWCEDYVVRSFYLKNLRTAETRTVTQFHYVNWSESGVPSSTKSLLDFRRKVNKSYRGKGNPILVHCSNGAGRSGTYALIDMVLSRIARGGVKQLDVAASLEHLRDQRMGLVASQAQYEFVLACIADETHAILTAMNAQH